MTSWRTVRRPAWLAVAACFVWSCAASDGSEPGSGSGTTVPTSATQTTDTESGQNPSSPSATDRSQAGGVIGVIDVVDVVEVIDGDTVRVVGGDGEQSVRLIGINTPEVGECFYGEATESLRSLIGGQQVALVRDVSDTDRYGRLLRFVELGDGTDVGAAQVDGGFAVSRRYEPDVARNDIYDELQAGAQAGARGQWAADACGAAMQSDAPIGIEIEFDAPGDDNHNLNAEWVRFTNEGAIDLDLTGWEVADESASHRYRFPELVLLPGSSVTVRTGCGSDAATELYWCNTDSAVWNNSGDTVFLRDPNGNTVVSHTYRN